MAITVDNKYSGSVSTDPVGEPIILRGKRGKRHAINLQCGAPKRYKLV